MLNHEHVKPFDPRLLLCNVKGIFIDCTTTFIDCTINQTVSNLLCSNVLLVILRGLDGVSISSECCIVNPLRMYCIE